MNRFLRDGLKDNHNKQDKEDVTEKDDAAQNGCTASHASDADQEIESNEMEVYDDAREIVEIPNLPLKDIDLAAISSSTLDGTQEDLCSTIPAKDQLVNETPASKSDTHEKCKCENG